MGRKLQGKHMNLFNAPWLDSAKDRKEPYFGLSRPESHGHYGRRMRGRYGARSTTESSEIGTARPVRAEQQAERRSA
jgi:hypothetical protein